MNIADMFKEDRTVLSYEVFPPKGDKPIESIYDTLDELGKLRPDFISVTSIFFPPLANILIYLAICIGVKLL